MRQFILIHSIFIIVSVLLTACTESPVGGNSISVGNRQITGKITLSDSARAEGVYVWMSGFGISSRTTPAGDFKIDIPPPSAQFTPGGVTGLFDVYFFLANYALSSTRVVLRNGEFLYSQGEIDGMGILDPPRELDKVLDIKIFIEPDTITTAYTGVIEVEIHLQTPDNGQAGIEFPASFGRPFGTVILRNLATGKILRFQSFKQDPVRNTTMIGSVVRIIEKDFDIGGTGGVLAPGVYEVIPHMRVEHEPIPMELLNSIGLNFDEPGEDYLNLPMRREGERLVVLPE